MQDHTNLAEVRIKLVLEIGDLALSHLPCTEVEHLFAARTNREREGVD